MKTILLIGSLLFQCVLFIIPLSFILIKASSEVGFYYVPPEFHIATGLPFLTWLSLILFYVGGDLRPGSRQVFRGIALGLTALCIGFLVVGAVLFPFEDIEFAAWLLVIALIIAGVLCFMHVVKR